MVLFQTYTQCMKKPIFLLIVITISFIACKKEKQDGPYVPIVRCTDLSRNMDTINHYIKGNWEWAEEYRVTRLRGAEYITPNTPGFDRISLKFSGDTARFFVNGLPDSVYRFRIQRMLEITNYPTDSLPVLVYYSFYTSLRKSHVPVMICKNQLLMQHQYVSSFVGENIWERK